MSESVTDPRVQKYVILGGMKAAVEASAAFDFEMLASTSRFYFARIMGSSGNSMEIISKSFEGYLNFDISSWKLHKDID